MIELIKKVKEEGDSLGGIIKGVIRKVPVGLGEPVFDKLHADLGKACLVLMRLRVSKSDPVLIQLLCEEVNIMMSL